MGCAPMCNCEYIILFAQIKKGSQNVGQMLVNKIVPSAISDMKASFILYLILCKARAQFYKSQFCNPLSVELFPVSQVQGALVLVHSVKWLTTAGSFVTAVPAIVVVVTLIPVRNTKVIITLELMKQARHTSTYQ